MKKFFLILSFSPFLMAGQKFSTEIINDPNASFKHRAQIDIQNIVRNNSNEQMTISADIKVANPNVNKASLSKFKEFGFGDKTQRASINIDTNGSELVMFEVTGNKGSWMFGNLKFSNDNTDFILFNPNGFNYYFNNTNVNSLKLVRDSAKIDRHGDLLWNELDNVNSGHIYFSKSRNSTRAYGQDSAYIDDCYQGFYNYNLTIKPNGEVENF